MDGSSDPFAGGRASVVEQMRRQQLLVTDLRALVLPSLGTAGDGRRSELVASLFDEVLSCSMIAISMLDGEIGGGAVAVVDDKSGVGKKAGERVERLDEEVRPNCGHKRRKSEQHSKSLITHVPHYDGRRWRKYGQKCINSAKYPRSYYRCTYRKGLGCPATKTIQQQEDNCLAGDSPAKYTVVYYGHHTCNCTAACTVQPPHVVGTNSCSDDGSETALANLFMLPDPQELSMDFDTPSQLQAITDGLSDSDNYWEMDSLIGFDDGITPIYAGGFNF